MQLTKNHTCDAGYISLPVSPASTLPNRIVHDGKTYHLKSELHISLVCMKRLCTMVPGLDEASAEKKIIHLFKEFTDRHPLSAYELTDEVRLVVKDERETLVAMVAVDGVAELFEYLNNQLGASFPTQPTHITLYTLQPDKGIGILSNDELQATSTQVTNDQITDALL